MEEGKGWEKSRAVSFLSQSQVYTALLWNVHSSYQHWIKPSLSFDCFILFHLILLRGI